MQKALRWILAIILWIFWFWFFKHNFNLSQYIEFLSTEWSTNFSKNFSIANPNTRWSFLYSNNTEPEIDPLDAKLAELNRIAELWVTTWENTNISWNINDETDLDINSFWTWVFSWTDSILSWFEDNWETLLSWKKTPKEDFFEDENTKTTWNDVASWNNNSNDFADFEDFFNEWEETTWTWNSEEEKEVTTNNTWENNNLTGENNQEEDFFESETTIPEETWDKEDWTWNNLSWTKKGDLTPLLQKRLQQYQEFKKTLD